MHKRIPYWEFDQIGTITEKSSPGIKDSPKNRKGEAVHIKKNLVIFTLGLVALIACSKSTPPPDLEALFSQRNVKGTMILATLDGSQIFTAYSERAKQGLLPASTFKIPNTLIAFDEAVISSPDEIFKWDGKVRSVEAWNQDHSLRTAFPVSCVWFYQELARRIGNENYLKHLRQMHYGNMQTGPDVTRFWLDGDLRISAEEQIAFLKKLYKNELPYSIEDIQLVKDIMVVDQTDEYTMHAKTGWAVRDDGEHLWYVGYVEQPEQVWFFATNLEISSNDQSQYHKEITREALKLTGVIPTSQ